MFTRKKLERLFGELITK